MTVLVRTVSATERELDAARWLATARRDFERAEAVVRTPDPEAAVFFFQQAAEKALKAVLWAEGISFPYTYSIDRLLVLLSARHPGLLRCPGNPERVSGYATRFRYPSPDGHDLARAEDVAEAALVATWLLRECTAALAGTVSDLAAEIEAERRRGLGREPPKA
jgi:HEPN domain-containing protein